MYAYGGYGYGSHEWNEHCSIFGRVVEFDGWECKIIAFTWNFELTSQSHWQYCYYYYFEKDLKQQWNTKRFNTLLIPFQTHTHTHTYTHRQADTQTQIWQFIRSIRQYATTLNRVSLSKRLGHETVFFRSEVYQL